MGVQFVTVLFGFRGEGLGTGGTVKDVLLKVVQVNGLPSDGREERHRTDGTLIEAFLVVEGPVIHQVMVSAQFLTTLGTLPRVQFTVGRL